MRETAEVATAAAPVTSPEATRTTALACIVVGIVLFIVFVAYKMRQRMSWRCCSAAGDATDAAQRAAVLSVAALLYRAAAADPACRPRPLATHRGWRPATAFPPPTLAPEEVHAVRSPHSPAAAAAHLETLMAGSPWSHMREVSQVSMAQLAPLPQHPHPPPQMVSALLPGSPKGTLGGPVVATGSGGSSQGSTTRGNGSGRAPAQRWSSVRDMVRAWGRSRRREEAEAGSGIGAADVLLSSGGAGGAPMPQHWGGLDLESQKTEVPCQLPEARAFTWSQMGLAAAASAASSRRTSDNYSPPQPRRTSPPGTTPLQGEVHANPVFASFDWSSHSGPAAAAAAAAAASSASGSGGDGGASTGRSFTHQIQRVPSRLGQAASFADPPAGCAGPLAAAAGGSWVGLGDSSSHGRRSSPLQPSAGGWGQEAQAVGICTRLSAQSLLQSQPEPEGLERIKE